MQTPIRLYDKKLGTILQSGIVCGKPFAALFNELTKWRNKMEYQLEIHLPGDYDKGDYIKMFTSTAPFLPLRAGDLLDASSWGRTGSKLLRVLNVEHVIEEKPGGGIDPSGKIIHRALIYTEGVVDSTQTRHESDTASYLGR
jgi:hypothetical protein